MNMNSTDELIALGLMDPPTKDHAGTPVSLAQLRAQAAELVRALSVLERHYPGCQILMHGEQVDQSQGADKPTQAGSGKPNGSQTNVGSAFTGSNRERVIAATANDFLGVSDIVRETGLTKKQVRAVLTATDTRSAFDRENQTDGTVKYRYKVPAAKE